jgi:hypothetical protein
MSKMPTPSRKKIKTPFRRNFPALEKQERRERKKNYLFGFFHLQYSFHRCIFTIGTFYINKT